MRADWSELAANDGDRSKWAVECEIDGCDVGLYRRAGLTRHGKPTATVKVFRCSQKNKVLYALTFAPTTVSSSSVGAEATARQALDSPYGRVRVSLRQRTDSSHHAPSTLRVASAVPASSTAEALTISLPPTAKFYNAASLALSHSIPLADQSVSAIQYEIGHLVVQADVYYDTAERLALRRILSDTHQLYPRDFMAAQRAAMEAASSKRESPSERLARFQSLLADPTLRARLAPTLRSAAELYVQNNSVVHTCDLTGDEEAAVWDACKRVKLEKVDGSAA